MTGSVINCLVNEQRYSCGMALPASVVGAGRNGNVTGCAFVDFVLAFADVLAVDDDDWPLEDACAGGLGGFKQTMTFAAVVVGGGGGLWWLD